MHASEQRPVPEIYLGVGLPPERDDTRARRANHARWCERDSAAGRVSDSERPAAVDKADGVQRAAAAHKHGPPWRRRSSAWPPYGWERKCHAVRVARNRRQRRRGALLRERRRGRPRLRARWRHARHRPAAQRRRHRVIPRHARRARPHAVARKHSANRRPVVAGERPDASQRTEAPPRVRADFFRP